jgi:thioredoxin 1
MTREEFDNQIAEGKVLVQFHAEWCGPCKALTPLLENTANNNNDISLVRIDVDEDSEIAREFSIRSIPTVFWYVNGELKTRQTGTLTSEQVFEGFKQR